MNRYAILSDPAFPALKEFVLGHTGLAYYRDKDEDLAVRLCRRLEALHLHDCDRYLRLLGAGPAGAHEMECLIGELTIGETYFFRQVEHFDLLKSIVLPDLIRRNAEQRRLRIWSAGCATGEEPYSIAILLDREFRAALAGWDVSILATDINHEFLERALTARYGEWSFRATPREVRAECFVRQGKFWLLRPEYKRRVRFERLNLAEENDVFRAGAAFDLIFCRNVMIYFSRELIGRTIGHFREVLRPGGWLIVGHAEFDALSFARFTRVQWNDASVYQNLEPAPASAPPAPAPRPTPVAQKRAPAPLPAPPIPPQQPAARPVPTVEQVRDLADRGSWHAATALGRQLAAREPLNAAAHFTLGLILESTQSCAEAKEALRRAIYLDRSFALAHFHLATCLQANGEAAQARKSFWNAIRLLDERSPDERLEHADGLTAADLKEMARLHLDLLEDRAKAV
jgi:chemotaxis protein methyltransferase CheR